jgi:quercetin dioxygenase-like cupin family protein
VTEHKLPEELEAQAILHALGILGPDDHRVFMVRLQGESDLLRQTAAAYRATTDALAAVVTPVRPPAALRDRVVHQIAVEAGHEAEQFELAANTLALAGTPVRPGDSVRERLLSRIERSSDVRRDVTDSEPILSETSAPSSDGGKNESEGRIAQDIGFLFSRAQSCWTTASNFIRTTLIRFVTSKRVGYWKAKIALQQPTKGLTFVKASEGTWRGIAPGVMAKLLSFDPISGRATTVLRFAPGTSYAPHRHTAVEELYVLEGGCRIAGREMGVGDYHRAETGTVHHDTSTDEGCLLLVTSSPQNEMLR